MNSSNRKGPLGKGAKREEKAIPLLMFKRIIRYPKFSPKVSPSYFNVHTTQRTTPLRLNIVFDCFIFLKILCEFFKHEEQLIFDRNNVRKMENVRERVKKRGKERTIRVRRLIN